MTSSKAERHVTMRVFVLSLLFSGLLTGCQGLDTIVSKPTQSVADTSNTSISYPDYVGPSTLVVGSPVLLTPSAKSSSSSVLSSAAFNATYSIVPPLPAGLTLNSSTGIISGVPIAIAKLASYTITADTASLAGSSSFSRTTAYHAGSSTSVTLFLSVIDLPPDVSYPASGFTARLGVPLGIAPRSAGGVVQSYSVKPALPDGIFLNTSTGVISGAAAALRGTNPIYPSTNNYVITAKNSGGSIDIPLAITVNIALPTLSYAPLPVLTRGTPMTASTPVFPPNPAPTPGAFTVTPALVGGLTLNSTTGVISGTPDPNAVNAPTIWETPPVTQYKISYTNPGGSVSYLLNIVVKDTPPVFTCPFGTVFFDKVPSTSADSFLDAIITVPGPSAVKNYSFSPALPTTGISHPQALDPGNAQTYNKVRVNLKTAAPLAATTYTVTGANSGGTSTCLLTLQIRDVIPNITYPTATNQYTVATATMELTKNQLIQTLSPSYNSGGTPTSCSATPALPAGLSLLSNCMITGTPSVPLLATTDYVISASNSGGAAASNPTVKIHIVDALPRISYSNSTGLLNTALSISPTLLSGSGAVDDCIMATGSTLPAGLSLSSACVISGTPTALSGPTIYRIIPRNKTTPTGNPQAGLEATLTLEIKDAVKEVSAGGGFTCIRSASGKVYCMGHNDNGQFGNGNTTNATTFTPMTMGTSIATSIVTGVSYVAALLSTGEVKAAGLIGATNTSSLTQLIASGILSISGGLEHICARTQTVVGSGNSVTCRGNNTLGQFETSTLDFYSDFNILFGLYNGGSFQFTPIQTITNGQPFGTTIGSTQISAGYVHNCTLDPDGAPFCWGTGNDRLGSASLANPTTSTNGNVKYGRQGRAFTSIASGGYFSCGLDTNSKIWCWGDIMGLGPQATQMSTANYSAIAAGGQHFCGIRTADKSVYCWGVGSYGQAGDGQISVNNTEVRAGSLTDVTQISMGDLHSCAIVGSTTPALWCWGTHATLDFEFVTGKSNAVGLQAASPTQMALPF